jgi:hypothetical protein
MSEKLPLCDALMYRGTMIVCVIPREAMVDGELLDDAPRFVVIGTANRQAVNLYECESIDEAISLVDAICAAGQVFNLPAGVAGGARAVECVAGSMQPE